MHNNLTKATVQIRVRYADCDPMGIVYYGNYAAWFEMARTEMLRNEGMTYRAMEKDGVFIVVAKLSIDYKKPARYDELIDVTAILRRSGGAKIEIDYEVTRDDELLCSGKTIMACLNKDAQIVAVPKCLEREPMDMQVMS